MFLSKGEISGLKLLQTGRKNRITLSFKGL